MKISAALIIILMLLSGIAKASPVTLEYKLKLGDQLEWKMSMGVKSTASGVSVETIIDSETLLTQIVSQVNNDSSYNLIEIANVKITQAKRGDEDIRSAMDKVEDLSALKQKMLKDGRITESSGMARLILPLGFQNQFRPFGVLPDNPIEPEATWAKVPQEDMDKLTVNYTFLGFETQKGYNCAKIKAEATGALQNSLFLRDGGDLVVEKATAIIYFAVEEGFDVLQNTSMTLKPEATAKTHFNLEVNIIAELLDKKSLMPEDAEKTAESLSLLESGVENLNKRDYNKAEEAFQNFLLIYKDKILRDHVEKLLAEVKAPTVERMSQLAQQGKLEELLALALEGMKNAPPGQKQTMQGIVLNAYLKSNRLPELIPPYEKFVKDNPDNPEGYNTLGRIYLFQDDKVKALEVFEKSAVLAPNDPDVHASLGFLYYESGMYENALTSYARSLQISPNSHYIYPEMAKTYVKMGKTDEATKLADDYEKIMQETLKASKNQNNDAIMQSILADIYVELSRYDEAIEIYMKSMELDPLRDTYYKKHLAEAYNRSGKPDMATQILDSMTTPASQFVGKPAPTFTLRDLNGIEVKLEDFKGKMIILNFWATWCPYCVREIPYFIELYEKYRDQGLAIIGVSTDRQGIDVVKSYVNHHKINYPILMANLKVQKDYGGVQSIPVTFVIDKEGKIVRHYNGYKDKDVFIQDIKSFLGNNTNSTEKLESSEPEGSKKTVNPVEALKLDAFEKIEIQAGDRDFTSVSSTPPDVLSGKGNQEAPDFVLVDMSNKGVQLSSLRGKVVLLDFWATWCDPSHKAMTYLDSLYKKYGDKGLMIIGMNNEGDQDRAMTFAKSRISYPVILSADKQFKDYSVTAIPSLFYIDKMGKVRYFDIGFGPDSEKEIEQKILELLAES